MQSLFYHMTTLAFVLVFCVLLMGLYTMSQGTSPNLSQKLMRWRVGLQFVAILVIMGFLFLARH